MAQKRNPLSLRTHTNFYTLSSWYTDFSWKYSDFLVYDSDMRDFIKSLYSLRKKSLYPIQMITLNLPGPIFSNFYTKGQNIFISSCLFSINKNFHIETSQKSSLKTGSSKIALHKKNIK